MHVGAILPQNDPLQSCILETIKARVFLNCSAVHFIYDVNSFFFSSCLLLCIMGVLGCAVCLNHWCIYNEHRGSI